MLQKRAARFATNNYCMESGNSSKNLDKLGWEPLEERRIRNKLIYFQKARLKLIDIPTEHLHFKQRQTRLGGDGPTYARFFSPIDGHRFSFFPDCQNLWNRLPSEVRTSVDLPYFTSSLEKINLTNIRSSMSVN